MQNGTANLENSSPFIINVTIFQQPACNAGYLGSIPGWGRSPGGGHGNPLQYSCMENSMDRGIWQATGHKVAKSWTQLSDWHFHFHTSNIPFLSIYPREIKTFSHLKMWPINEYFDMLLLLLAKSLQLCPTLCDPIDSSPPGLK